MILWHKSFQRVVVMMLILTMSIALARPLGADLLLCFGRNGHFDIAFGSCPENPFAPYQRNARIISEQDHHPACIDITITHGPFEKLARSAQNNKTFKLTARENRRHDTGFLAKLLSRKSDESGFLEFFHLNHRGFQPPHITTHRTTVLLI